MPVLYPSWEIRLKNQEINQSCFEVPQLLEHSPRVSQTDTTDTTETTDTSDTSETIGTTDTESQDAVDNSIPGFEGIYILTMIGFLSLFVLRRRRE
mgnify:CR=1 FL=1